MIPPTFVLVNAPCAPAGATLTHGDEEEFLAGICNDVAVRQVFCIFLFIYSVAKNIKIASALLILLPGTLKTQKYILRETFCKEIRICCFLQQAHWNVHMEFIKSCKVLKEQVVRFS